MQFGHQRLAEAHDLAFRPALGIEVGSALAATDGQASQRVLEGLFKAQEFDDADIHRRVKAHATLVGAERGTELHAKAAVDLHLSGIVTPKGYGR